MARAAGAPPLPASRHGSPLIPAALLSIHRKVMTRLFSQIQSNWRGKKERKTRAIVVKQLIRLQSKGKRTRGEPCARACTFCTALLFSPSLQHQGRRHERDSRDPWETLRRGHRVRFTVGHGDRSTSHQKASGCCRKQARATHPLECQGSNVNTHSGGHSAACTCAPVRRLWGDWAMEEEKLEQQVASVDRGIAFLKQEHLAMLTGLQMEITHLRRRCHGQSTADRLSSTSWVSLHSSWLMSVVFQSWAASWTPGSLTETQTVRGSNVWLTTEGNWCVGEAKILTDNHEEGKHKSSSEEDLEFTVK